MRATIKRSALALMALLMLAMSVFAATRKTEAATTYNNTTNAFIDCNVDSSGELQTVMCVTGMKGRTTRIKTELYIEKRILGIFWKKIDIGCPNNVWEDSTTSSIYNHTYVRVLPSSGTYRVTVTFTVSGTGGPDDIIVKTDTVSY